MLNEIKHTILYCVCENFCDSILLWFRAGSDFLAHSGSGSASQKVTVPKVPVPVPQRCKQSMKYMGTVCCGVVGGISLTAEQSGADLRGQDGPRPRHSQH